MLRLIFIFLLILAHSVSYGKKYTLSETPNGLCLKQWLGKDSVIDFNSHKELKKVKIIGEMAFEKALYMATIPTSASLSVFQKLSAVRSLIGSSVRKSLHEAHSSDNVRIKI